jgi:hypothetical protein
MLIENNKLNVQEFKEVFDSISWTRLPRKLGVNHTEYFYSGYWETPTFKVQITVRPSLVMALTETFKNRMVTDGSIPADGYRGQLVDWGSYIEMRVDQKFLDDVALRAVPKAEPSSSNIDKLEW